MPLIFIVYILLNPSPTRHHTLFAEYSKPNILHLWKQDFYLKLLLCKSIKATCFQKYLNRSTDNKDLT